MDLRDRNESGEVWDGSKVEVRNRIREQVSRCKPVVIIGCPSRTLIDVDRGREWNRAKTSAHQGFMAELCNEQQKYGRTFVHEFEDGSNSSGTPQSIRVATIFSRGAL